MDAVLSLLIPVVFVLSLVFERLFPARELPKVRFWLLKGFVFFVMTGVINALVPALVGPLLAPIALVPGTKLPLAVAALATLVLSELFSYGLHRFMHRVPFVWRWTHQMHHSAERVDVAGAAYFHPFDIVLQVFPTTLAATILGVSADAAALAGFASFLCAMFQHLNVRTPHWVGWIVQRPEGHSVHHQRGVHAYNYGNLALWDLVFGTFRNPKDFAPEAGFWDGASARVGAMLLGRDVGEPPMAAASSAVPALAKAEPEAMSAE